MVQRKVEFNKIGIVVTIVVTEGIKYMNALLKYIK